MSQGPVREAIRDLEAMGLVETVPFKGIPDPDADGEGCPGQLQRADLPGV